ncbi:MAG: undecaprenyldiphospho-muramoylpentapeptide beta-N-acetylglucosaminyltransferase [Bacillati bacterium ANGP1]|uniref:UDP-N-acetylglucosamine--N-acetylmuramyl-(pentapeptide) pyrophosphoryl-undecaprenol N-acetylglucosamine transferase n=1 Tax=Candidatus Segetimicrobium genomatis TaxID=2569760 RepID=A0A537IUJ0_9BACT|nr:MAG: undecaprenyldiphospho-muramoylpentapeptide beta-N-acetylglucosaminyltransferase [Terrabacteria group bacterium ANGP1]
MRVVIAGGGTGGHVYPGLAIAEALVSTRPQTEVLFVGGGGLERRVVPQAGWPFHRVAARAWPRRLSWSLPWAMLLTVAGTAQATLLLQRWRPQVVVATGGYAAAPIGAAAVVLKIPLVVQEQNLYPGAANRILARWARVISVPHERVAAHFGDKAVVTGVPVRAGALQGDRARGRQRFGLGDRQLTVLVLGGSQGARSLNAHVIEMAERLDGRAEVQILHQTGNEHEAWVRARLRSLGGSLRYVAVPFIEEMADAYACADLVVCRAGAGTLAEVTANGLPVVAVPYPYAAEGHQEANARLLESAGAAVVVLDRESNGVRLAQAVDALRADPSRLRAMAMASRRLGRPQAAREVAALVVAVAERGFS